MRHPSGDEVRTRQDESPSGVADRGQRLFRFLAEAQRLKYPAVEDTRTYPSVFWVHRFPEHPAVWGAFQEEEPEPDAPVVVVDRLPAEEDPPPLPKLIDGWVHRPIDDADTPPSLLEDILNPAAGSSGADNSRSFLSDHPEVAEAYQSWLELWRTWSEKVIFDRPVRDLYKALFATSVDATARREELEIVLGLGMLDWAPEGHPHVSRHVLTCPLTMDFDDLSGRITVAAQPDTEPLEIELEMLDPSLVGADLLNDVRQSVRELSGHPLHRSESGDVIRRLMNGLDPEATYNDTVAKPPTTDEPRSSFAPAIILRKRSSYGLIQVFESIADEVAERDEVPAGLMPLVDPDFEVPTEGDPTPGAIVSLDDVEDVMLPLSLNEKQLQVVQRANTHAQTLVQGPPGTGKTHTASALVSHFLAQGKRVLVTAQTDRALKEVRSKLPESIRPLAVSVVGANQEEFGNLKAAVDGLSQRASEQNAETGDQLAEHDIQEHLATIDSLRRRRAEIRRDMVQLREHEVLNHRHAGYEGTRAAIAQKHRSETAEHSWLLEFASPGPNVPAPLDHHQSRRWLVLLRDTELTTAEAEASKRLPDVKDVPNPDQFSFMVETEVAGACAAQNFSEFNDHVAYEAVAALSREGRAELQSRMQTIARRAHELEDNAESWMNQALHDVRRGRGAEWRARAQTINDLLQAAQPLVERIHPATTIRVQPNSNPAMLAGLASEVYNYVQQHGAVKTNPDGSPKIGTFTSRVIKNSRLLFQSVRVDGRPPTSAEGLAAFLNFTEGKRQLDALDRAWPAKTNIPSEDSLRERLQWHRSELGQLRRILELGDVLRTEEVDLEAAGLPRPDWGDINSVLTYARLVDAAAAHESHADAARPLDALATKLSTLGDWADAAHTTHELGGAVRDRNKNAYATAHERLVHLHRVRDLVAERDSLSRTVARAAPALSNAACQDPDDSAWSERIPILPSSWDWARTGAWLRTRPDADHIAVRDSMSKVEELIRREVEALASTRAWRHAIAPNRLTGRARANLAHYTERVRKLGKGTGKYAPQRRAEVRQAMDRCRPAVPAWILPLYRITEQLRVAQNMFDVVIVDEASQAGVEAAFLQYLAPKVIVIGDDKQVSPTAVGVNRQSMRDLANQYLFDNAYKSSWQDPELSLFDLCLARFGARITLVEHRRCVPEIIEFSNRVAYLPENIRLLPVRQPGTDRLEPIKVTHVPDGYEKGATGSKVNPPEVDAVVEQIQKCLADPAYDHLTFGVISLVGTAQARQIESRLADVLANQEWTARDLRCGDATDFQGSERDVIFLSMVSAAEERKRLGSLVRELYVQRFNVAASRAKDQLWLIHSVTLNDVPNPDDMRHQLLDYCYDIVNRRANEEPNSLRVSEDERDERFDSLFEQRVYNRIVEHGYTVEPQVDANGYRIDLVVIGGTSRLAIECDGDAWHGPERYLSDLARQRDLERCGWEFFRIRESDWYTDMNAVLESLWRTLDDHRIRPAGWRDDTATDDALEHELGQTPDRSEVQIGGIEPVGTVTPHSVTTDPFYSARHEAGILPPYEEFTGEVPHPGTARLADIVDGLARIVTVEGPVTGARLQRAYLDAAHARHTVQVQRILDRAISYAVRRGALINASPTEKRRITDRTFIVRHQPRLLVRQLGIRTVDQVPPLELASLLRTTGASLGWDDRERLFRAVLQQLGRDRLSRQASDVLEAALPLTREPDSGG